MVKPEIQDQSFQLAFVPTLGTHRPAWPPRSMCVFSEQLKQSCLEEVLEDFLLKAVTKIWLSHQGDKPVIICSGRFPSYAEGARLQGTSTTGTCVLS